MPPPDLGGGGRSPASLHGILFRLHPPSLLGEGGEGVPILFLGGRRGSKSFIRQTPGAPRRSARSLGQQRHLLAGAAGLRAPWAPTGLGFQGGHRLLPPGAWPQRRGPAHLGLEPRGRSGFRGPWGEGGAAGQRS